MTITVHAGFTGAMFGACGAQTSSDRQLSDASGRAVTCEKCKKMATTLAREVAA